MAIATMLRVLPRPWRRPFRGLAKSFNNRWLSGNRCCVRGRDNRIVLDGCILKRTRIDILGHGNRVSIGPESRLSDCVITVRGDGHDIAIGAECGLGVELEVMGERCRIAIGDGSTAVQASIAAYETGTAVVIGEDCMLSFEVDIRTGDSHGIVIDGVRLNPARDVRLGDHVWIGRGVSVLKGVSIGSNSIVGACSVVTRDLPADVIAAGVPARVLRRGANWVRDLRDLPPAEPAEPTLSSRSG